MSSAAVQEQHCEQRVVACDRLTELHEEEKRLIIRLSEVVAERARIYAELTKDIRTDFRCPGAFAAAVARRTMRTRGPRLIQIPR